MSVSPRIPPQNLEAEKSVLGSILLEKDAISKVSGMLKPEDFYAEAHGKTYAAMLQLFDQCVVIDLITLTECLRGKEMLDEVGGSSYLAELTVYVPTTAHIVEHALIVKNKSALRHLIHSGTVIAGLGYNEEEEVEKLLTVAEKELFSITRPSAYIAPPSNLDVLIQIEADRASGKPRGIPTGIDFLDEYTAGFGKGHIWTIGGWSGVGKSFFINDLILNTVKEHSTMLFSLEMTRREILERLLDEATRRAERTGESPIDIVNDPNLEIHDDKRTLPAIFMAIRSRETLPEIVYIDFIQKIITNDKTETERMSRIADALQTFALEMGICIVEVSTNNAESVNSETKSAGFRGSAMIEYAATVAIVLTRDRNETVEHPKLTFEVKKNKHGRAFSHDCQFDKKNARIIYHGI